MTDSNNKWPMYVVDEDIQYREKCRYFPFCDLVRHDGYTCNHESEAIKYCGKHRKLTENIKKGWGP